MKITSIIDSVSSEAFEMRRRSFPDFRTGRSGQVGLATRPAVTRQRHHAVPLEIAGQPNKRKGLGRKAFNDLQLTTSLAISPNSFAQLLLHLDTDQKID
jgi:hypothetical protein